jgi:hypothetical protein
MRTNYLKTGVKHSLETLHICVCVLRTMNSVQYNIQVKPPRLDPLKINRNKLIHHPGGVAH